MTANVATMLIAFVLAVILPVSRRHGLFDEFIPNFFLTDSRGKARGYGRQEQ
jgi:hypothetical protein